MDKENYYTILQLDLQMLFFLKYLFFGNTCLLENMWSDCSIPIGALSNDILRLYKVCADVSWIKLSFFNEKLATSFGIFRLCRPRQCARDWRSRKKSNRNRCNQKKNDCDQRDQNESDRNWRDQCLLFMFWQTRSNFGLFQPTQTDLDIFLPSWLNLFMLQPC